MSVIIDESIKKEPNLASSVSQAVSMVESVVGSSSEPVTAEFRRVHDERGRVVIEFALSDFAGSVRGRFEPRELSDPDQFEGRLRRLWDNLLQIRSHKQMDKLKKLVAELEE